MKKKKIVSIISSILCSFAFVGLFAIGLFVDNKQKKLETKAYNTVLLSQGAVNFNYSVTDFNFNVVGSWRYLELYQGANTKYQYEYRVNLYGNGVYNSQNTNFYASNNRDALNSEDLVFYSSIEDTVSTHHTLKLMSINFEGDPDRQEYAFTFSSNGHTSSVYGFLLPYSLGYQTISSYLSNLQDLRFVLVDEDFSYDPVNNYDIGYADGYTSGYSQGQQNGNQVGYNNGYEQGYNQGKEEQSNADNSLISQAYSSGYDDGYAQGESQDSTVNSIFGGMSTVALIPIRFFLSVFNFEILGINIASVVSALLSICLILVVWRIVMGGKSHD